MMALFILTAAVGAMCAWNTLTSITTLVVSATELTWERNERFDDKVPVHLDMRSAIPARSAVACAAGCLWEPECNTFFYREFSGECLRQRMVYVAPGAVTSVPGWRYFKIVSGGPDSISDRVSGSHYRLDFTVVGEWLEARKTCLEHGEDLVVLEPVVKAQFIQDFFRANYTGLEKSIGIYIGAQRPDASAPFPTSGPDFLWVNGEWVNMDATSSFWEPGHPDFNEQRGVMKLDPWLNYRWSEANPTWGNKLSLCEKPFLARHY